MAKYPKIVLFGYVRQFLLGCEVLIILPTAWYYIKSLGKNELFLSFVLCSFNVSGIIAGPLFGRITDRIGHPRELFLLISVIQVVGNLLYSVNVSAFFPLIGRLLNGLECGGGAILSGQIAMQTEVRERGTIFLFWKGIFCLGASFGAGVGSFITFEINIFGWHIDRGNSPGIVMTIIWTLLLIVAITLPKEMWVERGTRSKQSELVRSVSNDDEARLTTGYNSDDRKSADYNPNGIQELAKYNSEEEQMLTNNNLKDDAKIVWNSQICCLIYLIVFNIVIFGTSEICVPILALDHYHLQLIHVKLLFLNSSAFTLLTFILLSLALKHFKERQLFVIVLGMQIAAISLLASIGFGWNHITMAQNYILLLYICLGMPFFALSFGSAILSKITDPRNASFFQGSTYAALNLGLIISRIASSLILSKENLIAYCFALAFFWVIGLIWFCVHYKQFIAPEEKNK